MTLSDADALGATAPPIDAGDPEQLAQRAASDPEPPKGQPTEPVASPADGMLVMCDVAMSACVRASAARAGVKWNDDLARLSRLSPSDRAALSIFAPMAAPFFGDAVQKAPKIGAAAFGLAFLFIVVDHSRQVAAMAPAKAPKPVPKEGAPVTGPTAAIPTTDHNLKGDGTAPTPEEVRDHQQLWGSAADAVPVGTKPVDTGEFGPKRGEGAAA